MNTVSPALVTQRSAARLPRIALFGLCAAYLLPGIVGRDPWRNADLVAYAQMLGIAEGRMAWLAPALGGVSVIDPAWLPNGLGALFIRLLAPLGEPALAARIPFALLLALTLVLVWYATFHLARTEHAQPLPLAFGGEAEPVSYARAVADGALLAFIATLGLLQPGHETTPELAQLCAASLYVYALAAAPYRRWQPRVAVMVALTMLAASGAPSIGVALGLAGTVVCLRSAYEPARRYAPWVLGATVLAAVLATAWGAWRWRGQPLDLDAARSIARQWAWFLWPAWPLALWTLWRWRGHLLHRHLSVPLTLALTAMLSSVLMGGSDRALMLAVPATAILAAFALPTFKRSTSAAIDWFSVFFFTLCAAAIWVIYVAVQTGVPAKPAANVAKLAPGFPTTFSPLALALATAGTLAWIALVRWRTGRHREALWKSLVLPAGGVALCWLLLMTLWLPLLDYARSARPWVERVSAHLPPGICVLAPGASPVVVAALEQAGRWRVVAAADGVASSECRWQLRVSRTGRPQPPAAPWELVAEIKRPTDRDEVTAIYRRVP